MTLSIIPKNPIGVNPSMTTTILNIVLVAAVYMTAPLIPLFGAVGISIVYEKIAKLTRNIWLHLLTA